MCLLYLDKMRRVYFTRVSTHLWFVTRIKQWPLPQLVTDHVKWLFLWPTGNFGNGHGNRARYFEINITDTCREPVSPLSRWNDTHLFPHASASSQLKEMRALNLRLLYLDERARSWGPPFRTGNGLLHCPIYYWHVCNELSKWSPLLTDQCL
jgi:hypothetical protein